MTIDDKIENEKLATAKTPKTTKISALSSGNIN